MDPYLFCLILGIAGLGVMAFSGLAAHGHDAHGHAHGHGHGDDVGDVALHGHGVKDTGGIHVKDVGGHGMKDVGGHGHGMKDAGHVHVKDAGHHVHVKDTHGHDGPAHGHDGDVHGGDGHDFGDTVSEYLLSLLSPRVVFSILVGLGAAGLLLDPFLGGVLLLLTAIVAGMAFEGLLVRPFWNFFFKFASAPAQTLETALMDRATAVTGFDAQGQGLVSIILDGQIVQLLGTLRPEDRQQGVRVRAGDELMVEDVDGRRNRCVVSWLGAGAPGDDGR